MNTENFNELLKKRRSIRKFTDEPVDDNTIKELVEAAVLAPSAFNAQNWKFIAVKSKQDIQSVAEAVEKGIRRIFRDESEDFINSRIKQMTFFRKAPLVFFIYKTKAKYHDQRVIDALEKYGIPQEGIMNYMGQPDILGVAAAIENLLLKAVELDLGACWMCDPIMCQAEIDKELDVSGDMSLVGVIPVGKNNGYNPREKKLKDINEILSIR